MPKFTHYLQPDAMDCGPTCLRIVAKHFGRHYNLETLRNLTWKTREGVSLLTISDAAEKIGYPQTDVSRRETCKREVVCYVH